MGEMARRAELVALRAPPAAPGRPDRVPERLVGVRARRVAVGVRQRRAGRPVVPGGAWAGSAGHARRPVGLIVTGLALPVARGVGRGGAGGRARRVVRQRRAGLAQEQVRACVRRARRGVEAGGARRVAGHARQVRGGVRGVGPELRAVLAQLRVPCHPVHTERAGGARRRPGQRVGAIRAQLALLVLGPPLVQKLQTGIAEGPGRARDAPAVQELVARRANAVVALVLRGALVAHALGRVKVRGLVPAARLAPQPVGAVRAFLAARARRHPRDRIQAGKVLALRAVIRRLQPREHLVRRVVPAVQHAAADRI